MEAFAGLVAGLHHPVHILDVGGTEVFWKLNRAHLLVPHRITLLNLTREQHLELPNLEAVQGDARSMSAFDDKSFDICFSNSVIEHVGSFEDQKAMAGEVRRVASSYFIQTPNRAFPLEPHFLVPCWQFLPVSLRAWLHHRFDLGWMTRQADPAEARSEVEQIRLLSDSEMRELFPEAEILCEKIGPLTKAFIALRSPGGENPEVPRAGGIESPAFRRAR